MHVRELRDIHVKSVRVCAKNHVRMNMIFTSNRIVQTRNYFFTFINFFHFEHRKVIGNIMGIEQSDQNGQKWQKWDPTCFIMRVWKNVCVRAQKFRANNIFMFCQFWSNRTVRFIMWILSYVNDKKWSEVTETKDAIKLNKSVRIRWQESRRAKQKDELNFFPKWSLLFTFVTFVQNCQNWSKRSLFASTRLKRLQTIET